MKIAILSNVTISLIGDILKKNNSVYIPDGFDTWIQESLSPSEELRNFNPDLIFVLIDGRAYFESGRGIGSVSESVKSLSSVFTNSKIFVSSVDIPQFRYSGFSKPDVSAEFEHAWYENVLKRLDDFSNAFVFNLKGLVSRIGQESFYDRRMSYFASMPWSLKGMNAIAVEMERTVEACAGICRKVLAIDFDNTLWHGEAGGTVSSMTEKESLPYVDFQRVLKSLKEHGVLLVGLSKNNEEDTDAVWQRGDMILEKNDFVAIRSNWESKVDNLLDIAAQLNLSPDSFVFIDDSPVEREEMKLRLPEVALPGFPADTANLETWMIDTAKKYFPKMDVTAEDASRTEMYSSAFARESEKAGLSMEDFLKGLEMRLSVELARVEDVARLSQLSQKTNQFNIASSRYTERNLREMIQKDGVFVFSVRLKDKFGDEGIVGLVVVQTEKEIAFIKEFVMSCRVMKRTVEFAIEEKIESFLAKKGINKIKAEYVTTPKNKPVADLFDKFGYVCTEENEARKFYVLEIPRISSLNHFCGK